MKLPFLSKGKGGQPREEVNYHFIFIEAQEQQVGAEVINWGESTWWPKDCYMRFIRKTPPGPLQVGTRFEQRVTWGSPLISGWLPRWNVEVTKLIKDREIERTFLNGMFQGSETVYVEERYNGSKVIYEMRFRLVGFFNKLLWRLLFRKLHDKSIKRILAALNDYVLKKKEKDSKA